MFNKSFSLIVAFDKSYGIGLNNTIPWKLPNDLFNFKKLTTNNIIIMGRKTWDSLPVKPLPNRINIIVSSKSSYSFNESNIHYVNSFEQALNITTRYNTNKEIFVIGGSKIYEEALKNENCQTLYLSILDQDYKCDTFFPFQYLNNYKIVSDTLENGYIYRKCKRLKNSDLINQEELQYLNLVKDVLNTGKYVNDRTKIGRIIKFGTQIRFSLEDNVLPLLTTKKMFVKGVIGELLWMLNGETNSKLLEQQGINIWKGNSSRKFLDDHNLDYDEGECGPIYGFQWRRFGGDFQKINSIHKYFNNREITNTILQYTDDYSGYDQITECIRLIKEEPNSTRIIISGWNPVQLKEQVLPACHSFYQFNVIDNKLSCMLTLRSNDLGLGMPYNICSASLLTYIMAELTNLKPYELIYSIGNYHIYSNHVEQMKEQITRKPFAFPKFNFKRKIKSIDDLKMDDFIISNYNSHPSIKMEMAV